MARALLQEVEAAQAAKAMEDLKEYEGSVQRALQDDITSWEQKYNVLSDEHSKYQADIMAQVQELQKQNRNYDEELKIAFNKHIEDGNRIKLLEREVKGRLAGFGAKGSINCSVEQPVHFQNLSSSGLLKPNSCQGW